MLAINVASDAGVADVENQPVNREHLDLKHGARGLPEKQKELIEEMFNWFLGRSVNGDAPDESTIRKKIRGFWGRLRPE